MSVEGRIYDRDKGRSCLDREKQLARLFQISKCVLSVSPALPTQTLLARQGTTWTGGLTLRPCLWKDHSCLQAASDTFEYSDMR